MKKIALIIQRYGLEVNGGAEYHCRVLAEKLKYLYQVEILTTCAKDHMTWANEYPEGVTTIDDVKVRRFGVLHPRNKSKVHHLANRLNNRSLPQKILRLLHLTDIAAKIFSVKQDTVALGNEWSKQQGPYTPSLMVFLENTQKEYDALIFFTYLYFPTFYGLRIAPDKSIFIPTAHDEPSIHLPIFDQVFNSPKAILYNTLSEKQLVNRLFNNAAIYSDVVGIGIDEVAESKLNAADLLKTDFPYLIYIGRIDPGKGCDLMLEYFLRYKTHTGCDVQLVLIGKSFMDIPKHADIINMGFVDDDVKNVLLAGAKALIMPSHYESLSLVTLESMKAGIPVIVNEYCEVLKDHIENSKGGFTFGNYDSFKIAIDSVLNDDIMLSAMQHNARNYVSKNYNWEVVLGKFKRAIDFVSE